MTTLTFEVLIDIQQTYCQTFSFVQITHQTLNVEFLLKPCKAL